MPKFPSPAYNTIPDSDPQIKRVDLDNMEVASRPSAMPKGVKNDFRIQHVPNKK